MGDEVGVSVSIRIVNPCKITKQQFIESEMCTEEIYEFLAISFVHGISQVYAGATGSGKTTIMADIMSNIPDHRRLITIENPCVNLTSLSVTKTAKKSTTSYIL